MNIKTDYNIEKDVELIDRIVSTLESDTGVEGATAIAQLLKAKSMLIGTSLGLAGMEVMKDEMEKMEKEESEV